MINQNLILYFVPAMICAISAWGQEAGNPSWLKSQDWKKAAPSPFARVESPTAVVDGKLYLFGGFTSSLGASTQLDVYDPATDTWSRLKDMPTGVTHLNPAMDGKTIWFAGGFKGKHPGPVTDEVWKYDVSSDRWVAGPALPEPRGGGGLAVVGRTLHFFGGYKPDRQTDSGDHWSLSLDDGKAWEREADLPDPRGHVAAIALGGMVYALGGDHGHDRTQIDVASCHRFDPATKKWTAVASLPDGRSHFESSTLIHGGQIIVIGGRCNQTKPPRGVVRDVLAYDPKADTWTVVGDLPGVLLAPSAAIISGRMVITGGGLNNPMPLTEKTWTASMPTPEGQGRVFDLGDGRRALVSQLECLPFVDDAYSQRFRFDRFENPKLKELRTRYKLDEVIASGQTEFEQQVRLMDWTHQQFKKFGQPSTKAFGALEILRDIGEGQTFFCSQYVQVLVSAAASLGWVDRPLALRRHQGVNKVGGSTEHSTTEIWSNQYGKWVMLDPTSNLYVTRDGLPLNAVEIRTEWFYHGGTNLRFVIGKEQKAYRASELPVVLKNFAGFGELALHPDEMDKYGFIGFIPNTDYLDNGPDYGNMFIVQDDLCKGTAWHTRPIPENPAVDPYFPIGQASLSLSVEKGMIRCALRTFTPNYSRFERRLDEGDWHPADATFAWDVVDGANRVEVRTVNAFGITGPISTAMLVVSVGAAR
ncbi:MAG: N-acetylneuraminic acid mutarotase [Kiritimatiellia bacterium]|jgi:N-acetylneuraminic acid mutarotase